jgi:hypothetical protein
LAGGFLTVNVDAFPADFAADLPKPLARFMAISQVRISGKAFGSNATVASWKDKPSYAIVATQDRMINPDLERFMYKRSRAQTIELPGSSDRHVEAHKASPRVLCQCKMPFQISWAVSANQNSSRSS